MHCEETKRYKYLASVLVRPVGAEGTFEVMEFSVWLPNAMATAGQVFQEWQEHLGNHYESNGVRQINCKETEGVGVDYQFQGKEDDYAL